MAGVFLLAGLMMTVSAMIMVEGYCIGSIDGTVALNNYGNPEMIDEQAADPFIENGGQWDKDIHFASRTSFGHIAFGSDFILFNVKEGPENENEVGPVDLEEQIVQGTVIRMDLLDTEEVHPRGLDKLPYPTNIFYGNDPSSWGTNLASYRKVIYEDIWDGIDLVYDSSDVHIKYEFVVDPWVDTDNIRFQLTGLESVSSMDDCLIMTTSHGTNLIDGGLRSFYIDPTYKEVDTDFHMNTDGSIGYQLSGRDSSKTIVIDPIIYATFIGGTDSEYEVDMAMDGSGACYLAGSTYSFDFPTTTGAYSTRSAGEMDGYVMKIRPDGSSPIYSTYIGGNRWDEISSIDIDESGNAYIAGHSDSTNFPTTRDAFNETLNGSMADLVAVKLDSTGSRLQYSTYIGGNESESMDNQGSIKVDGSGNLFITATSWSGNFPLTDDAFDKYNNETGEEEWKWRSGKVVLVKLDPFGSELLYSTYIGGSDWDTANGLDLDSEGFVYVFGSTSSYDFPLTKGAYDTSMDSWSSLFVFKFNIKTSSMVYSTFLGGSDYQSGYDLKVDGSGRAYVVGDTGSFDFPTTDGAYQTEINGWSDLFVTAFDPTGSSLFVSTLLGGSDSDSAKGIDLDDDGNIIITGETWSDDFPTVVTNKEDTSQDDPDLIIVKLSKDADELIYSTVIGGTTGIGYPEDIGQNIFLVSERRVVVSGATGSSKFPVTDDAWDNKMTDWNDIFLMDFDMSLPPGIPRNFSLEQGDAYLNITWNLPATDGGMSIKGYSIYKGLAEDELKIVNSLTTDLYFNDTDLEMGKRYFYMVCAVNGVGSSLPTEILGSQAASKPTPPQFFQVVRGNGWVKLSWEPPVFDGSYFLEGYRIYKEPEGENTTMIDLDIVKLQYYDSDVVNGLNYTYYITTWNRIGESLPSKENWVIPQGESSAPLDLSLVNRSDSIILAWSPPEDDGGSGILFYRVYIGTVKGEEVYWRYVNTPEMEYNDTLVEIGKSYLYYVTAVNSEGESEPSMEVQGGPVSEPSSPEDLQVNEGNGYLMLTWKEPSFLGGLDLIGFRLYRSQGSGDPELVTELEYNEHFYKDEGLDNGVTYTYRLTAFNDFGVSEMTPEIQGTPATVPGIPTGLTASASSSSVQLDWESPTENGGALVINYLIFRKDQGQDIVQIGTVTTGTNSYVDTEVEPGAEYSYAVKARNRMGPSQISLEVSVVALGPPGSPQNVVYTAGEGSIEISWDEPVMNGGVEITGYIILRNDPELTSEIMVSEIGPQNGSFMDDGIENGMTYRYSVISVNALGTSSPVWSDPLTPLGHPDTPNTIGLEIDGNSVIITWKAPDDDGGAEIGFYRIYRIFGDGEPVLIGVVEVGTLTFVDDEKKEGGQYSYEVVAVNNVGESITPAKGSIDVSGLDKDEKGFIEENTGLLVTVPMIILLLILLIILLIKRKDNGGSVQMTPMPTPVDQTDGQTQYVDGYQEPILEGPIPNGELDPAMEAPEQYEM